MKSEVCASLPCVAQVLIGVPVEGPFDYIIPEDMAPVALPGTRVLVRFAGRKRVGIVVRRIAASMHGGALSTVIKVLDENPVFSGAFLELADFFAARFASTPGEALELFLPSYLRGNKRLDAPAASACPRKARVELVVDRGQSRRWDVLLPRIAQTLHAGCGVLVLLPDSSHCPDVLPKLGPLAKADERVLLTQGTDKEEYARWLGVRSGASRLAVGFISAVFAPVKDLGLIIVMDEESTCYRNDRSPFYHAREVALARSALEGCDVVCVSSSPSVEMWQRVEEDRAALTFLQEDLPGVKFLDLSNFKMKKGAFVSLGLRQHIEKTVREGGRVLLYIQAARGVGGSVDEVKKYFPDIIVAGYDKSSSALPGRFDVLVATQAVFRHRAQLKVAVSAVLDIDWELHKHDYQAAHGLFAFLTRLRQMTQQYVLCQTRHALDPLLHVLASPDMRDFYRYEFAQRQQMGMPPFRELVTLVVRSADPQLACAQAKTLYDGFMSKGMDDILVLEPQQDRMAMARGKFRYCLLLQGARRDVVVGRVKEVLKMVRLKKDTIVTVNVA